MKIINETNFELDAPLEFDYLILAQEELINLFSNISLTNKKGPKK